MFSKIGVMILSLGVMSSDSRTLLIPLALVMIGAIMVVLGEGSAENEKK